MSADGRTSAEPFYGLTRWKTSIFSRNEATLCEGVSVGRMDGATYAVYTALFLNAKNEQFSR